MSDKERFLALRKKLFSMIKYQLEQDPCCKSYEGLIEVTSEFPCYFDDNNAEEAASYYEITLRCYVLGPQRHYKFTGNTASEALDKFEDALNEWAEGRE